MFYCHEKRILVLLVIFLIFNNSIFAQRKWSCIAGYTVSDAIWDTPRPSPTPLSIKGASMVLGSNYKPCVREHCAGGLVNNNEIYIYGGATLENAYASDLWVYDISQQKWAFVEDKGASRITDQIGKESTWAMPGGRNRTTSVIDNDGNLWLFGGLYYTAASGGVSESDLWKYNFKTHRWTFWGENDYSGNKPSARYRTRGWFDSNNNLWIYAGADDRSGGTGSFNDLWMYNTHTNIWTFISGNKNTYYTKSTTNGNYPSAVGMGGTQYFPRARSDYGYWLDNSGNFWIYAGYVESHGSDEFGDLWKFNPTTKVWTLMSGSSAFNTEQTSTTPASRNAPYCWKGNDGNLYFFGGLRKYLYFMRDCWRFNISTGSWETVRNDNITNKVSNFTNYFREDSTIIPGTQVCNLSNITTSGYTYMFNGYGYGTNNVSGYTGAIWRYSLENFDTKLIPKAISDTIVAPFSPSINYNLTANDSLKTGAVKKYTFDLDIGIAGRQDSLITAAGKFKVDSVGILTFKPVAGFVGSATLYYTFQNSIGYVSNTAKISMSVYTCPSDTLSLVSSRNDATKGNYDYRANNNVVVSNKIIPSPNNYLLTTITSSKSIQFLPGFVVQAGLKSNFTAQIGGCN